VSQEEKNTEDLTILAAIETLERGADPSVAEGPRGDETVETLARLYTEVLGLIPCGLDPVAPSPGARERLLAAIGAAPPDTRAPEPRPVPVAAPAPAPAPVAMTESLRPAPRVAPGPIPRRHSRWPLGLAAVLALAFAGLSGWLWITRQEQRAEIARLRQELAMHQQLAAQAGQEGQQARTEMEKMRDRFALVTSPAVDVRPLRPVGDQADARGLLFVAPDHQHWYLALEGLEPPAEGGVYKLWWVTEQGPVDAGSLQNGEKVEMGSDQMPAGIREVMITLEPDGSSARPQGRPVLQAAMT
jgi:hypothetical protein